MEGTFKELMELHDFPFDSQVRFRALWLQRCIVPEMY